VGDRRVEFGLFLPQVSFAYIDILERARLCESLGFTSIWLFDHLFSPGQPDRPSLEAWTLATALLAHTSTLRVGHLVLCNNFRHPALLARMATTLDVISGGRLEFGIGSGSVAGEHALGGFPWGTGLERTERLGEALEIITLMFRQPETTFSGRHYQIHDLPNQPRPVQEPGPPIHVGGAGPRTLEMVARYADVWNVPTYALRDWRTKADELDAACDRIGRDPLSVRRSVEAVMVIGPDQTAVDGAMAGAQRRYGGPGWGLVEGGFVGTPPAIVERIATLVAEGFTSFIFVAADRAQEATLRLFGEEVIPHFVGASA